MKTQLKDRILWYDGTNQVKPEMVSSLLLNGVSLDKIAVLHKNADINLFEQLSDESITDSKECNDQLYFDWVIPDEFKNLNLTQYAMKLVANHPLEYQERMQHELNEIKERRLEMLFKTLIYTIDTFKATKTVWGVGRGSSCASLLLHLLGLHLVDPVKYDIPLSEFFHD